MFNTILGLILAGYGVYTFSTYQGDLTPFYYAKYGILVLVGGGIALYNGLTQLKNIRFPSLLTKKENTVKELSKEIVIENEEEQDVQAIFYLTERLKGMPEGLELCKKLNALLFDLHHPSK
jgi:hypothetical protein